MATTIPPRATIRVTNLALRTIIGFDRWERTKKQDVVINLEIEFDPRRAVRTDALKDTLNYKKIKREVIALVEKSRFRLLERLAGKIVETVMKNPRALSATVRVDKPHALRFAESVSVEMHAERTK